MPDRIAPIVFLLIAFAVLAIHGCTKSREEERARQVATRVRTEFLHAWNNYERYAWGHDSLRPLSKTSRDWYGQSLQMTPVDALDTLVLMTLTSEAARGQALIVNLPGKPSAIRDCLLAVFPAIPYCIDLLEGPCLTTHEWPNRQLR